MTFIASVIAKKGVALIADSLVTSSLPILHHRKFLDHLAAQIPNAGGEITITPSDISGLFEYEAHCDNQILMIFQFLLMIS